MALTLKDLHWFWGADGKLVTDGQLAWVVRDGADVAQSAMRTDIGQIARFVVEEGGEAGNFTVRPELHSSNQIATVDSELGANVAITFGYGDYQRLTDWSKGRGIPMINLARERRLEAARLQGERESADIGRQGLPALSGGALSRCLESLGGVATMAQLVALVSPAAEDRTRTDQIDTSKVERALEEVARTVTIRGTQVLVRNGDGMLTNKRRALLRALHQIDAADDDRSLGVALRALKRCMRADQFAALERALGLTRVDRAVMWPEQTEAWDGSEQNEPTARTAAAEQGLGGGEQGAVTSASESQSVAVFVEFGDVRTGAQCIPATGRTVITVGPLDGDRFLDPTAAAIAVARKSDEDDPIPVNGWSTWRVDDGTGRTLEDWFNDRQHEDAQ